MAEVTGKEGKSWGRREGEWKRGRGRDDANCAAAVLGIRASHLELHSLLLELALEDLADVLVLRRHRNGG